MKSEESRTVVACATDKRFAMPLAVMLRSAADTLARGSVLDVFLIDGGVPADVRVRLDRILDQIPARCTWLSGVSAVPAVLNPDSPKTASVYLRFALPSLLPREVERVIYLDADTLVRADLSELQSAPLDDKLLLATEDFAIPTLAEPMGVSNYAQLGLQGSEPYFNSGVMVLNIRAWREEGIQERAITYAVNNQPRMTLNDQEALNACLAGRWGRLDPRWNQQTRIFSYQQWPETAFKLSMREHLPELINEPWIVHFTGVHKPWIHTCLHPMRDAWCDALRRSGWFTPAEFAGWYVRLQSRQFAYRVGKRIARRHG